MAGPGQGSGLLEKLVTGDLEVADVARALVGMTLAVSGANEVIEGALSELRSGASDIMGALGAPLDEP